jgi:hypothetical protein
MTTRSLGKQIKESNPTFACVGEKEYLGEGGRSAGI